MNRIISLLIVFSLMLIIGAIAESSRTDDAVVFLNGIDVLKHINSKESVEEAHQILEGITSNYNQANMFRTYAAAIIDIYDEKFDDAQTKMDVLALNEQFNSILEKYELQSCEVVGLYISARRAENEGRYSDAFEIYTSINFLDSLDRSIELAGKSKEEAYAAAEALFEQGMYVEVAEAFDALGQYKDSAARASESRARVTPEPTPVPTPAPLENNGIFDDIDIHITLDDPNYQLVIDVNGCTDNLFDVKVDRPDSLHCYEAFNYSDQNWTLVSARFELPEDNSASGGHTVSFVFEDIIIEVYFNLHYKENNSSYPYEAEYMGYCIYSKP